MEGTTTYTDRTTYTDASGGDGTDWIDAQRAAGWRVLAGWGRDGWDLGSWPLVVYAARRTADGAVVVAERVEGDMTEWTFSTDADAVAHLDALAAHWWDVDDNGPDDPADGRGPYPADRPLC